MIQSLTFKVLECNYKLFINLDISYKTLKLLITTIRILLCLTKIELCGLLTWGHLILFLTLGRLKLCCIDLNSSESLIVSCIKWKRSRSHELHSRWASCIPWIHIFHVVAFDYFKGPTTGKIYIMGPHVCGLCWALLLNTICIQWIK